MKSFDKILFAIYLSLQLTCTLSAQNCKSLLRVTTDSDSARIYVDGRLSGTGGLDIELGKGSHIIKASEAPRLWNPRTLTDSINISGCGETKNIRFSFADFRYLNTSPQDASVSVHDSVIGYTPLFIPDSVSTVYLKKEGYSPERINLISIPSDRKFDLRFTGKPYGKSFYRREIFKYLLGGIVLLGGATAYFKLKADNRFSEYQATGIASKLTETRKYDLISGITMGALEINFGILLYYFLKD